MGFMLRIKLAVVVLGIVGVVMGFQNLRKSNGASSAPQHFELAALENGSRPVGNPYLSIGPHTALFTHAVMYGEQNTDGSFSNLDYVIYPAISSENPFQENLETLGDNPYQLAPLDKTVLLVKTYRYTHESQLPGAFTEVPAVTGMVMPGAAPLSGEIFGLLKQDIPHLNQARVIVLEDGETPSSMLASFGLMGLGVLGALAGIAWLFKKS